MAPNMIAKCRSSVGRVISRDTKKAGSGFFISKDGHFLTNNHVVHTIHIDDTTHAITVEYSNEIYIQTVGETSPARLLMDDQGDEPIVYDYAVLKDRSITRNICGPWSTQCGGSGRRRGGMKID